MKKTSSRLPVSRVVRSAMISVVILLAGSASLAQTQSDSNQEACSRHKKADAEMNAVYRQVLSTHKKDLLFVAKFKVAQRAWVAFRDAHLESLYPEPNKLQAYGSVNPMCRCTVLTDLTAERTKQMKQWLTGAEEGDVCSGSVRIKN